MHEDRSICQGGWRRNAEIFVVWEEERLQFHEKKQTKKQSDKGTKEEMIKQGRRRRRKRRGGRGRGRGRRGRRRRATPNLREEHGGKGPWIFRESQTSAYSHTFEPLDRLFGKSGQLVLLLFSTIQLLEVLSTPSCFSPHTK